MFRKSKSVFSDEVQGTMISGSVERSTESRNDIIKINLKSGLINFSIENGRSDTMSLFFGERCLTFTNSSHGTASFWMEMGDQHYNILYGSHSRDGITEDTIQMGRGFADDILCALGLEPGQDSWKSFILYMGGQAQMILLFYGLYMTDLFERGETESFTNVYDIYQWAEAGFSEDAQPKIN